MDITIYLINKEMNTIETTINMLYKYIKCNFLKIANKTYKEIEQSKIIAQKNQRHNIESIFDPVILLFNVHFFT